jgi:hypothetical protein
MAILKTKKYQQGGIVPIDNTRVAGRGVIPTIMEDSDNLSREDMGDKRPMLKRFYDGIFNKDFRTRVTNALNPYGYIPDPINFAKRFANPQSKETSTGLNLNNKYSRNRYDAVNMYADLPQKFGTFEESYFRPTVGYENYEKAYTFKDPNKRMRYLQLASQFGLLDKSPDAPLEDRQVNFEDAGSKGGNSVMNTGILGFGKDEQGEYVSFTDEWDLAGKDDLPITNRVYGRPFLIYDRIYVDENDKKRLRTLPRKTPNYNPTDVKDNEGVVKDIKIAMPAVMDQIKRKNSNMRSAEQFLDKLRGTKNIGK